MRSSGSGTVCSCEILKDTGVAVDVATLGHTWSCGRAEADRTSCALVRLERWLRAHGRIGSGRIGESGRGRDDDGEDVAPIEVDVRVGKVGSVIACGLD